MISQLGGVYYNLSGVLFCIAIFKKKREREEAGNAAHLYQQVVAFGLRREVEERLDEGLPQGPFSVVLLRVFHRLLRLEGPHRDVAYHLSGEGSSHSTYENRK